MTISPSLSPVSKRLPEILSFPLIFWYLGTYLLFTSLTCYSPILTSLVLPTTRTRMALCRRRSKLPRGIIKLRLRRSLLRRFVKRQISKREAIADLPTNAFYGGERALLYGTAEDMLANFGLNGKACLLRAICEIQGHPLSNFGLIGEMLKLLFT